VAEGARLESVYTRKRIQGSNPCLSAIFSMSFAEKLAAITLPNSDGQQIRLGSLWEQRPAVVAFLRHYG
jgi:hypothetical protein